MAIKCRRINTLKVKQHCSAYYMIDGKFKYCEGDDLVGLFVPYDQYGKKCVVKVEVYAEGATFPADIPHYNCKVFIYDTSRELLVCYFHF